MISTKYKISSVLGAVALMQAASVAYAQSATTPATKADLEQLSEVVVTGTSLRGVAPVGSTATTVGRDDVLTSTAVSTVDLLQQLPQVFSLGVDENHRGAGGTGNRSGASSVNLRGLGSGTTLTLINGHRVATQGLQGGFVDPSVVPSIALDRVEIVADGASAIYGSDAVAGVVNLIPRTKFDGVEVSGRIGRADSYNNRQIGAIFGTHWSSGRVTVAAEYNGHDALFGRDRSFVRLDLTPFGGTDYRIGNCNPANYFLANQYYPTPRTTGAVNGVTLANLTNKCDNSGYAVLTPKQERTGVYATLQQTLSDKIEWVTDAYAYRRRSILPAYLTAATYAIGAATPAAVRGLFANGTQVQYDLGPFVGGRQFDNERGADSYDINTGLNIRVFNDWRIQAFVNYSRNKEFDGTVYGLDTAAMNSLINTGVLNPLAPALLSATDIARISDNPFLVDTRSKLLEYRVALDGKLFKMPGGDAQLAVGASYRDENMTNQQIGPLTAAQLGPQNGGVLVPGGYDLSRKIKSAFAEVLLPVVGADNAMAGIRRLDFDAAVRYDDYGKGVGSTSNPKIGANWSPLAGVTIRGSYGQSFRAPDLPSGISANPRILIQVRSDPTAGNQNVNVAYINDGNPTLTPEKADTWSAGIDFAPEALAGFKASLTYWSIDYTNKFGGIGLSDAAILGKAALYGALFVKAPTAAQLTAALVGRNCSIGGTATSCTDPTQIPYMVDARVQNVGVVKTTGIDFDVRYLLHTEKLGAFNFSIAGTSIQKYLEQATAAAPASDRINFLGYPLKLRHRTTVGWAKSGWSANVAYDYTNSYNNDSVAPIQTIEAYKFVDLNLAYDFQDKGWLKDTRIGINVNNLFDKDPPFANLNGAGLVGYGYDAQYSNPIGRLVTLVLNKKF